MDNASTSRVTVSRPKITLMMLMCSIVSAAGVGAVSAATTEDDAMSIKVHYNAQSLDTDSGAKSLYRQLVKAAVEVCPQDASPHLISSAVRQCREESVARAVNKIHNEKLAAVYAANAKNNG
jgi:UrcA family protein